MDAHGGRPQEALGTNSRRVGHPGFTWPPFGILDAAPGSNRHEGCPELLEAVLEAKPRLHVFGHIHAGYGTLRTPETIFINAALFDEGGTMEREPIVLDLSAR